MPANCYEIEAIYSRGEKAKKNAAPVVSGWKYTVAGGGSIELNFPTKGGYVLTDVKIDGVSDPDALAAGKHTFTDVQKDYKLEAFFELP